ncbi:hypothetical protein FC16_GL001060 [Loigolactobacillus coryniformis subsp. torquens DSM 20004 = KCTC 3535]|nr:hypothetical protein FC16_GL001060 [Loigolactobacillus coryniformis subsp. torquens DSM 20004 = KCTC 3535]
MCTPVHIVPFNYLLYLNKKFKCWWRRPNSGRKEQWRHILLLLILPLLTKRGKIAY